MGQGIHPQRFYGWQDMSVNALSAAIGVFTLKAMGMTASRLWFLPPLCILMTLHLAALFIVLSGVPFR